MAVFANERPAAGLRLLIIDARVPTPDRDGGSLRMVSLCELLIERGVRISLVASWPESFPPFSDSLAGDSARLEAIGIELPARGVETVEQHLERHGARYDVVLMTGAFVASRHLSAVQRLAPQALLVFDTIDLHHLREFRAAKLTGSVPRLRHAMTLKRIELAVARAADFTIVVSERERDVLLTEVPELRVLVVPNIHDVRPDDVPAGERRHLMFLGAFTFDPNADAMRYFVGDVLPRLRAQVPDLELTIVGSDPTPEVLALQGNGVTVTGFVDDLSAWFSRARVFVAPLRYGAGIKGKLLISMAHGVPAVASPVAAEGIPAVENRDIFVARSTPEWCERTLELLRDDHTWTAMSRAGRSLIEQHYSRAANAVHVDRLLQALLARRAPHLEWA